MRTYLTLLTLTLAVYSALAQDPGMQAARQAMQQTQFAAQAAQQANDQAMRDAQQASQAMMQNAQQQAMQNTPQCYRCFAAKPRFSVKSGAYPAVVTLKIRDSDSRSRDLLHDGRLDANGGVNPIRRSNYDCFDNHAASHCHLALRRT